MIRAGFSIADIDEIENTFDHRFANDIFKQVGVQREIEQIEKKLMMFEAFKMALFSVESGPKNDPEVNSRTSARWVRKAQRRISKLRNEKIWSVWDNVKGSRRF